MYRSESFFPSESYEMTSWLVSIDRRSKIIQRSVTFNRGRLSFPKRRLIPIDLISGYYAKRMAENDTHNRDSFYPTSYPDIRRYMAYGKSKWSVEYGCVLRRIKRYRS